MPLLAPDFVFSQGCLQDYVECPMRFGLRYVQRVAWPAPVAEPMLTYEQSVADGEAFHRLVHQHILGIPADRLTPFAGDGDLARWWANYSAREPARVLPEAHYPEAGLAAVVEGFRLLARYDLIAAQPGQGAVIVDWKTGKPAPYAALMTRLQTRVYRYVLATAGAHLNGGKAWLPEQVQMIYWYADQPEKSECLAYDPDQYAADALYLGGLVRRIAGASSADLTCSTDDRHCAYCRYRSLCERAGRAGDWYAGLEPDDTARDAEIDIAFEQVGEIAF